MRNIKLTLAYDGSDFNGWQVQPGRPTIQGALHEALWKVLGGPMMLPQGSGRTDAGVHALGQVAAFQTVLPIPTEKIALALNDVLPDAIRVLSAEEATSDFHPRRSAKAKTYRYRIYRSRSCPPFLARYVLHHPYPLDEGAIAEAAITVEGEHDFTSFAAVDPEKRDALEEPDNVRSIYSSLWRREGDEFVYEVRGSGFLHHMVRNLVGTFLLVGRGSLKKDDVKRILGARQRSAAGATAEARGLYLVNVEY